MSNLCQLTRHCGFHAHKFLKSERHGGSPLARCVNAAGERAVEFARLLDADVESHRFGPGLGKNIDELRILAPTRRRESVSLLRARLNANERQLAVQRYFKNNV